MTPWAVRAAQEAAVREAEDAARAAVAAEKKAAEMKNRLEVIFGTGPKAAFSAPPVTKCQGTLAPAHAAAAAAFYLECVYPSSMGKEHMHHHSQRSAIRRELFR